MKNYIFTMSEFFIVLLPILKLFCCILNICSIRSSQNCFQKPHISIVRDKIEVAIFGNKHDEIIIGTEDGSIKVRK